MGKLLVAKRSKNGFNVELEEIEVQARFGLLKLEDLQCAVGGYIEQLNLCDEFRRNRIDAFCDEEGKLKELDMNMVMFKKQPGSSYIQIVDIVVGNVVFAGHDEMGQSLPLTDRQIKFIKQKLEKGTLNTNDDSCVEGVKAVEVFAVEV